jgi:hypothetical protein
MQAWTAATPPPGSPTTRRLAAAASRTSNGRAPGLEREAEPKPNGKIREIQRRLAGGRSTKQRTKEGAGRGGRRVRGLAARSGVVGWSVERGGRERYREEVQQQHSGGGWKETGRGARALKTRRKRRTA